MPGTRKLGRATSHRTAMLRAMVTFLLENGKIETTVTRAKEVRSLAEKMITIAKTIRSAQQAPCDGICHKGELLQISFSRRLRRSMLTATAAIPASRSSGRAAATQRRWRSSS